LLFLLLPLLFFPSQFIYANLFMSEMLLQTCLLLAFYFVVHFVLHKKNSALWMYQLFITLALLIKPVWYLFPLVSVLFFILMIRQKQFAVQTVFSHALPILIVVGIFIHNHHQTNYWEYSSIQRKLMINYNVFGVLEQHLGKQAALLEVEKMQDAAALKSSYAEQARFLQQEINKVLWQHPFAFAWIECKGVARFFLDHSRYDMEYFFSTIAPQQSSWQNELAANGWSGLLNRFKGFNFFYFGYLIVSILVNALLLLGVLIFSRQKTIPVAIRIALVLMLLYTAILTGPSGTTRFRLPVYFLLIFAWGIALPVAKEWCSKHLLLKHKLT